MKYPIRAVVGKRGSCKTLFLTYTADNLSKSGKLVIANFHLFDIDYQYMSFKDIYKNLNDLYDCILMLDEGHVGSDAYDFFRKNTRKLTNFITQIRKRHIEIWTTTQIFTQLTKRFRDQVDYIYLTQATEIDGISTMEIHDRSMPYPESKIKMFAFDGRRWFNKYDTDEIIYNEEEDIINGNKKRKKIEKISTT